MPLVVMSGRYVQGVVDAEDGGERSLLRVRDRWDSIGGGHFMCDGCTETSEPAKGTRPNTVKQNPCPVLPTSIQNKPAIGNSAPTTTFPPALILTCSSTIDVHDDDRSSNYIPLSHYEVLTI